MSFLPILFNQKYKDLDKFKNTKIISMFHSYDKDMFKFQSSIFKNLDMNYNKKVKYQNAFKLSIENSDFTYFFNNSKKLENAYNHKEIKPLLKKNNHKIIEMKDILDTSSKMELYNSIKDDLESFVKT